jgi:hypothetical protein
MISVFLCVKSENDCNKELSDKLSDNCYRTRNVPKDVACCTSYGEHLEFAFSRSTHDHHINMTISDVGQNDLRRLSPQHFTRVIGCGQTHTGDKILKVLLAGVFAVRMEVFYFFGRHTERVHFGQFDAMYHLLS